MTNEVPSGLFVSKSSDFLMFIKLSSYSNLITHKFVISLHVVHFITQFMSWPSTCCFLWNQVLCLFKFYPLGKMENFIQLDCICRYTTVTVVPSLSIDDNLVIEISGVVCKKNYSKVPNNRRVLISGMGSEICVKYDKRRVGISF